MAARAARAPHEHFPAMHVGASSDKAGLGDEKTCGAGTNFLVDSSLR